MDAECETVVAHEHGLPGVGLSVPETTVPSYDALLSGVSTHAIFDALAAKSRAELSAALPALKRIGDRIKRFMRLVPNRGMYSAYSQVIVVLNHVELFVWHKMQPLRPNLDEPELPPTQII